jgi:hypothetical protein
VTRQRLSEAHTSVLMKNQCKSTNHSETLQRGLFEANRAYHKSKERAGAIPAFFFMSLTNTVFMFIIGSSWNSIEAQNRKGETTWKNSQRCKLQT